MIADLQAIGDYASGKAKVFEDGFAQIGDNRFPRDYWGRGTICKEAGAFLQTNEKDGNGVYQYYFSVTEEKNFIASSVTVAGIV